MANLLAVAVRDLFRAIERLVTGAVLRHILAELAKPAAAAALAQ
ncbi:hypothetical protein QA641_06340 [Bradyrhizobium sp. CB1650]|nr:hypothetical protein [Bradyrhizobium sp. CB1650]WGD53530.1 hypothetical protein QA641_06340 [Bradyrhizobium sp. CB1650]